jgi:hypothetical protein
MQQQVVVEAPIDVEEPVSVDETTLTIRDKDTNDIIAKISVGQLIPFSGVWLQVIAIVENGIIMQPAAYTHKKKKNLSKKRR